MLPAMHGVYRNGPVKNVQEGTARARWQRTKLRQDHRQRLAAH